jgi:putative flippase GtrA
MKLNLKINKKRIFEILKYLFSAGSSFVLDLALFTLFMFLLSNFFGKNAIIMATIMARIISSLYNYYINARFVFGNVEKITIIRYYALVIVQMMVSAFLVFAISSVVSLNTTFIKVPVDIFIFIINYFIQREFVFKRK